MVPVILVAIANPGATDSRALYKESRTRDYTPVPSAGGAQAAEFRSVSGGAERFRAFISKELVPFVQRHFRTDPNDRTIIGHSYGGLFASHAMLAEPSLFRRYIIISPSLWYANRTVLSIARAGAGPAAATGSVAYFAVGAREQSMMKDDLDALVKVLRRRSGRHLKLRLQLFPHDDHDSIFPAAVAQGLLAVFPPPPRVNKP
jgi:predicted alpha/beta superfamily hydrolase